MNGTPWDRIALDLLTATGQTFQMVGVALLFTIALGLPLGILLVITAPGGLWQAPGGSPRVGATLHTVLGFGVNVGRSLPFIILMVALIPLTRVLVGASIGVWAAVVPLAVAAIPFFARLVEIAIREVDSGLVEAATALGASPFTIIGKVLIPESLPGVVLGLSTSVISLINYSAMAGIIGAGGIGDLAFRYGYQRYDDRYMWSTIVLLIILVQVLQAVGSATARKLDHR